MMGPTMSSVPPPEPDADPAPPVPSRWQRFRAAPRPLRVTTYVVLVVVLALVVALVVGVVVVRRPLPETAGRLTVAGLGAPVEVVRDEHGVPQLYADTSEDLFLAQGYVTASERFFQMDVHRRAAAGRLAELFGEPALDSDRLARTLGWERTARAELALVEPDTRTALAAYAAGVNAYLADRAPTDLAVEYTLLSLRGRAPNPAPWSEVDSLAWLKAMSWELAGNLDDEVDRALTAAAVGSRAAAGLFPETGVADPVVGQGAVVDGVFEQDADRGGTRNPRRPAPFGAVRAVALAPDVRAALQRTRRGLAALPSFVARGAGKGSNAWVVDGEHSTTGAPLLAGDPHLDTALPGPWLQIGLHCRTVTEACPYDVSGLSVPGAPGVQVGHTEGVAWQTTSLGADTTDLFVERIEGETYRYDGATQQLRTRTETISVAGGADVELVVRSTRHGPLLSDAFTTYADVATQAPLAGRRAVDPATGQEQRHAVAVSWTGSRPSSSLDAVLGLDRARDGEDLREALADVTSPAQGVVWADTGGHIGFQAAGALPVRKSGNDGALPSAGWRPETEWTAALVPSAGLPSLVDPADGVLVAANQAVAGPGYPYLVTTTPDPGYRAARIREMLDSALAEGPVSAEQLGAMQLDTLNPLAAVLVPRLLRVALPGGYASAGQRLLVGWDGTQGADDPAAAYLNAVWHDLLDRTFHDDVPARAWPTGGARWVQVVTRLLDRPRSAWWDDVTTEDVVETRDDVLAASMLQARDDLTRLQAVDVADWAWGRRHTVDLVSEPYGRWGNAAVRRLLNRTGTPSGGGGASVDATDWDAADPVDTYRVTTAPSARMLVDLGDLDASRWVTLAGVSGHPASSHYADQVDVWARGETLPWPSSSDAVHAAARDTLVLEPRR